MFYVRGANFPRQVEIFRDLRELYRTPKRLERIAAVVAAFTLIVAGFRAQKQSYTRRIMETVTVTLDAETFRSKTMIQPT